MFEIGEKVVCTWNFSGSTNPPKINEIVTIETIEDIGETVFLSISEYLFETNGEEQCFCSKGFRKLDRQFTDDLLERITNEVKEEQVILI